MKWLRGFSKSLRSPEAESAAAPAGATSTVNHPAAPAAVTGPFIRKGLVRLSVGLDFGTHSTKAAFFEFGAGARVFRPVRFDHGLRGWPDFVLPAVGVIRHGGLVWGADAAAELDARPWNEGIRRLKVLLAALADSDFADGRLCQDYERHLDSAGVDGQLWRPEHVAAAALAVQMSEVHSRLHALYAGRLVEAQFTIPVPIDHAENSDVLAVYHRVANTAAKLISEDGNLKVPNEELVVAAAEEYTGSSSEDLPEGRVHALPEAVAQIAGYLTSLEATPGVHGVVDIGAGTTDVSVFLLDRSVRHVQECYWYSALAIPRAAAFVHQVVASTLAAEMRDRITETGLMHECQQRGDAVAVALDVIRRRSNQAWATAFGHLKKEGEWHGCPLFLCGGGALLPRVETVFAPSWVPGWRLHEVRALPVPSDYLGDGVPFGRMAVAYGLAIPKPEHGAYVLPKDAPDHTPPKHYSWKYYLTKGGQDKVYPKPGWV